MVSNQTWEGIEDSSGKAHTVWLHRQLPILDGNDGSSSSSSSAVATIPWTPMRKDDCLALNRATAAAAADGEETSADSDAEGTSASSPGCTTKNTSNLEEGSPTNLTNEKKNTIVYTDGGRGTADLTTMRLRHNFFPGRPDRELCCAVWFVREDRKGRSSNNGTATADNHNASSNKSKSNNNNNKFILFPIVDKADAEQIEAFYQTALLNNGEPAPSASSSLGSEKQDDECVVLPSGTGKIEIHKVGTVWTLRRIPIAPPRGGFSLPLMWSPSPQILQRGYGEYTIPGEDVECALGPVRHVMFVIHGIGEAYFSRPDIPVSVPSLLEQTNVARMELQTRQYAAYQKKCSAAKTSKQQPPPPPARIELIPIEWFQHLHNSSSALKKSLQATTLTSIPALRAIANDVVLDVLMYMTPAFCEAVLETITRQIKDLYERILQHVYPDAMKERGGTLSLVGHSLGSVICWDLLAVLKQKQQQTNNLTASSTSSLDSMRGGDGSTVVPHHPPSDGAAAGTASPGIDFPTVASPVGGTDSGQTSTKPLAYEAYGPTLTQPMSETIPFVPEHTLFLGSPVGLFLTLRGAHPFFDSMRNIVPRDVTNTSDPLLLPPTVSPFSLPTYSLYNIFHPR